MSVETTQPPKQSSQRSPARKSPVSKRKAKNLSLRHMLYAALASACVTSISLNSGELAWMKDVLCTGSMLSGETSLP